MKELKRLAVICAVLAIVVMLAACGKAPEQQTGQTEAPAAPSAGEGSEAPAQENAPTEGKAAEGELGDYYVKIGEWFLTKDYEGKDALVVSFEFTNNSDEAKAFLYAVSDKAYQDGIQLETAILMNVDGYEVENSMKEIKKGATLQVQQAFVLDSITSPVEIEVTEFISFSDDMLYKLIEIA